MTGAFPMCQPGRSIWGRHLAMALIRNPELEAFSYAVRAAEARVLQAGVRPNTELQVELDEYDRDGAGLNSAETAVVLAQALSLAESGNGVGWLPRLKANWLGLPDQAARCTGGNRKVVY